MPQTTLVALYSWDVTSRRTCGVTDDPGRAAEEVMTALEAAPFGAMGTVRQVVLGSEAYVNLGEVARMRRTGDEVVMWTEPRPRDRDHVFQPARPPGPRDGEA